MERQINDPDHFFHWNIAFTKAEKRKKIAARFKKFKELQQVNLISWM